VTDPDPPATTSLETLRKVRATELEWERRIAEGRSRSDELLRTLREEAEALVAAARTDAERERTRVIEAARTAADREAAGIAAEGERAATEAAGGPAVGAERRAAILAAVLNDLGTR